MKQEKPAASAEGALWEGFEARRAKDRRKRTIAAACAAALLVLVAAFCLWYTRPRTWADLTGEDAALLSASLTMADPDWDADTAMDKLGYKFWQVRQDDPNLDQAGGAVLQALGRYTYRASLGSLIPRDGISTGWKDDLTAAIAWGEDNHHFFYFGNDGRVVFPNNWGYDIYHCDPALFGELVEILQTYGALKETRG